MLPDQQTSGAGNCGTAAIQRILGLDIALRCTGYGIIDTDGKACRAVDCGVIRTAAGKPMSECLRRIAGGIGELITEYAPDTAALEGGFFSRNAKTAMILGMARGAVVANLTQLLIPIYEYAPRRIKQAVCGYGNASKEQISLMVAKQLNLDVNQVPDDATDALGAAICHIQAAYGLQALLLPKPL